VPFDGLCSSCTFTLSSDGSGGRVLRTRRAIISSLKNDGYWLYRIAKSPCRWPFRRKSCTWPLAEMNFRPLRNGISAYSFITNESDVFKKIVEIVQCSDTYSNEQKTGRKHANDLRRVSPQLSPTVGCSSRATSPRPRLGGLLATGHAAFDRKETFFGPPYLSFHILKRE